MLAYPHFEKDKPLNSLCTFGIGGKANYYLVVRTSEELKAALTACKELCLNYFILGKGSNLLFSDQGFNGVVIHNKMDFIKYKEEGIVHVGAGTSFSLLGSQTARQGWSGLEFASGIPASVGGALFMNAGANGTDTSERLISVEFIDPEGNISHFDKQQLSFAYRYSSFQIMKGAILSVTFQLTKNEEAQEKKLSILRYRQATQPYNLKSAGCIFRNPPHSSAGALIEACGLKGTKIGDAEISIKHANFIVNKGHATAKDVLDLIDLVRHEVALKKGIILESEIRIVPDYFKELP